MLPDVTLLTVNEVGRRVGLSRPSIYRAIDRGTFPKPCYPAPRAPRWRSDEIAEWIDAASVRREDDFREARRSRQERAA